ncbi:hypothetical protein ACIA9I_34935 [Streptomyces anulatus]
MPIARGGFPLLRPDISSFTREVAARLPGHWKSDNHRTPLAGDPAASRLWDSGPLAHTAVTDTGHERSVITSAVGLQLYVTGHPSRTADVIVAPLLPAGSRVVHARGIAPPRGITVPADPARAAALIRRRLLFGLRLASMKAQSNTCPGPGMPIAVTLGPNGWPQVEVAYARALYELLVKEGFLLNPATGRCQLPATTWPPDVGRRTAKAVRRLEQLGYSITTRQTDGRTSASSLPVGPPLRQRPDVGGPPRASRTTI